MRKFIVKLFSSDVEDPTSWDDLGWKVHSFSSRHRSYTNPDTLFPDGRPSIGLRSKLAAGTAFVLDYSEHGSCAWVLHNRGYRDPFDSVSGAGLLVWEGKPCDLAKTKEERAKAAAQFLETYTCWCNGDAYGFSVDEEITLPCGHAELRDGDSCGGFYGNEVDHMIETILGSIPSEPVDLEITGNCDFLGDRLRAALDKRNAVPKAS